MLTRGIGIGLHILLARVEEELQLVINGEGVAGLVLSILFFHDFDLDFFRVGIFLLLLLSCLLFLSGLPLVLICLSGTSL